MTTCDVRVLVIWEKVLGGSLERVRRTAGIISGPHVQQFWDPDATVGGWAMANLAWDEPQGPAWDVFYLFDRDATWIERPGPIIAWGFPIAEQRRILADGLRGLIS